MYLRFVYTFEMPPLPFGKDNIKTKTGKDNIKTKTAIIAIDPY